MAKLRIFYHQRSILIRSTLSLLIIFVVLLQTFSMLVISVQADSGEKQPTQTLSFRGKSRIGAVEAFFRPNEAAEASLGSERIIFEWRNFQPNGPQDWVTDSIAPEWIERANRDDRIVVGLIKNAPHWATGTQLFGAVPLGIDLPLDDPNNYWAAFVRKLTQYYSSRYGGIHHWIIYNEPDIRPNAEKDNFFEFAGTTQDYYKVLKTAYKVAHATDTQAVIHLAGFSYWQDIVSNRPQYLERLLRIIMSDPEAKQNNLFFDSFSVHVFGGTDWVWYMTRLFKHYPEKYGYSKSVWVEEMNVLLTQDDGYPVANRQPPVSLDEQAKFIIQGTALGLAAGADQVQVYKLFDNDMAPGYEPWGLIRGDGTHRPAYDALKTASKYFGTATDARRVRNNAATMVTLLKPGQTVYVMWNRTRTPVTLRVRAVPSLNAVPVVSKLGKVTYLPASESRNGYYEFSLPGCTGFCDIQGEPIILIQPGTPQPAWTLSDNVFLTPLVSIGKD